MDRKARLNLLYITLALIGVYVAQGFLARNTAVADIPYSQFQTLLKSGQVTAVRVAQDHLEGELKAPLDGKISFVTTRVEPGFAKDLDAAGVAYSGVVPSNPMFFSSYVFLFSLLVGGVAWYFMGKRLTGSASAGMMAIGKSKAKVYVETDTKTSFADVAGVDEAKEELKEIVNFLKDPKAFGRLGARMPKGVLLVGPPGTGKTLLAKAVAGEAGVPFYAISGSEFVEMFVGVGAARVRDLFEQARKTAPAIIFIDELDALGRARGAGGPMGGGHDEKEQTLNQLLVELDGFDGGSGLVLLAATNRPEVLDPALLRAGRFDRQVLVDRPDRAGRVQILEVHARKVQLDPDVKLDEVAALTPGFTGADLANLLNEAALVATRRQAERIGMNDFNAAIERIIAGLEKKNRLLNAREREIVAHHELGHALVAAALPGTDVVHKISIIPRGIGALGYTIQRPTEDRFLMTREELLNKMAVLMGGRAAEQVVFSHLSTGASDDLARATDIARSMVTRFGMGGEGLGPVTYETEPQSFLGQAVGSRRDYAEDTAQAIDTAIRGLVEEAFQRARRLLIRNRELLSDGARELLTRETLAGDELGTLLGRVRTEEPLAA